MHEYSLASVQRERTGMQVKMEVRVLAATVAVIKTPIAHNVIEKARLLIVKARR